MERLAEFMSQLKEDEVLSLLERCMKADIPAAEILSSCQKGMRLVGLMHERGQYFIAGLIMAGEIMSQVVDLLRPALTRKRPKEVLGKVLLGTMEGDIHDIGKNLFKDLLECHGFTVLDLGVDVPPAHFLEAADDFLPDVVAVSFLITDSFPHLRRLVDLIHEAKSKKGKRPLIMIGGGQVDERIFRMSGSDYWAPDAFGGVKLCIELMTGGKRAEGVKDGRRGRKKVSQSGS
jgi:methanogenic corrinoid protein MtbC1